MNYRFQLFSVLYVFCAILCPRFAKADTTLAIVGDSGAFNSKATDVANMIGDLGTPTTPWNTDYVFTTGDNSYGQIDVGHNDWDKIVGKRYGQFMKARTNATGIYLNQTSATQRFFPAVGNHDASPDGTGQDGSDGGILPGYLDYYHNDPDTTSGRLPAGVHELEQSYYEVELPIQGGAGTVQIFVLDSNALRVNSASREAQTSWLKNGLENSTAIWKFVSVHHPAYNSTGRGGDYLLQLPYQQWGAHAVFSGHAHSYERIQVTDGIQEDFPYFVTGLGGLPPHQFRTTSLGSRNQYGGSLATNGAMRVVVNDQTATFEFLSIDDGTSGGNGGRVTDSLTIRQDELPQAPTGNRLIGQGSEWYYLDDGSNQGTSWKEGAFDPIQAGWNSGNAQLGYGNLFETTMVDYGTNSEAKPITTYFRRDFEVTAANLAQFEMLTLGLVRDDGAAVYLNGVEIRRDNLLPNAAYNSLSTRAIENVRESHKVSTNLGASLLQLGTNVLAVEVHQFSQDSPDLAFDLTLDGGRVNYGNNTPGKSTGFEEAVVGNVAYGRNKNKIELAWGQEFFGFSGISEVRDSIDSVPLGENQLVVSNRSTRVISETIDIRDLQDVQVSIDVRAFTRDGSGFESGDSILLGVQTSLDGITFTDSTWESFVAGDDFLLAGQAVGSANGVFETSESPLGFIGEDVKSIKVFIRAINNSSNEFMIFDDIQISGNYTADFDMDGDVDVQDLAQWEASFGTNNGADSDGDSDSDGADFLAWQRQYAGNLTTTSSGVPEPSTAVLMISLTVIGTWIRTWN